MARAHRVDDELRAVTQVLFVDRLDVSLEDQLGARVRGHTEGEAHAPEDAVGENGGLDGSDRSIAGGKLLGTELVPRVDSTARPRARVGPPTRPCPPPPALATKPPSYPLFAGRHRPCDGKPP
jgi:hypothetical protein